MRYINEMRDGENVVGHYFCREKHSLKTRAGKTYFSIILTDRTGAMECKIWDLNNNIQSFESGDYVKVDGSVNLFNDALQMKVNKIRRSDAGEYDPADYMPTTAHNIDDMFERLMAYPKTFKNDFIYQLITNIFTNAEISNMFKTSTAAMAMHHAYAGGLLEHTLSVVELCDVCAAKYKYVNRDVLLASAMLHDLGKIWEFTGFPGNKYTDAGQLLGHIYMAAELVGKEAAKLDNFPLQLEMALKHCLLAHHGEYEFGSPKLPGLLEAWILSACDNLDAKTAGFTEFLEKDKNPGQWSEYKKMFERSIRSTEV
ncbi:MAG: OB-fold nucleic acid binding domain-containing protein [Defluviitaleaceae bacterium]|nr:OB-fold nucleic acid binding domain-containing protein [Defluviitaleaceae bacterium]